MKQREREERLKKQKQYQRERLLAKKHLMKKTKRGQPVLSNQMDVLLRKIQTNIQQ